MGTTTATSRRQHLLDFIEHPRTGKEERDTARRMLARLDAKAATEAGQAPRADHRWYGAKYDHERRLRTTDIAALIRQDIKLAVKLARLAAAPGALAVPDPFTGVPAQIRYSIRSKYFSGGSSIDIFIQHIPDAWGFAEQEDPYWPGHMETRPTPELRALAAALKEIMGAYNHDGSDSMTDHYDVRFYGSVMNEGGLILG
jgi:hypothetical protein